MAIKDSGTQISILNLTFLPDLEAMGQEKIALTLARGENIEAKLCKIQIILKNDTNQVLWEPIAILVAITKMLNMACLFPPYSILEILEMVGPDEQETKEPEDKKEVSAAR